MNPFYAAACLLQIGGGVWWCMHGDVKLGVVSFIWAAASGWLALP